MFKVTTPRLLAVMFMPAALLLWWPTQAQNTVPIIPQPAAGGTRGPSALLFAPDGRELYVAEQDENQIAIVAAESGKPLAHLPSGGEQPVGMALSPDARTLVVANSFSGSVGIIDMEKRTLRARVALPGMPYGVAVAANGKAFVSVSQRDEVAVIDLSAAKVTARIPVGHHPRALLLTPDGTTLICADMADGTVSLIDAATAKERGRIALPAINLRGMALSADGTRIYVTAQKPNNEVPADNPETMWANVLCVVKIANGTGAVERVLTLDQPGRGAADPCGIAVNAKGDTAYIALSGAHEAAVVSLGAATEGAAASAILRRIPVGANPRPLAIRPHSGEIWIGNHLGNSLSVLNPEADSARLLDLGAPTPSPNRRLKGRFLFASAHLTRGTRFSCETCHPDGGTDGLTWKFKHVNDALELRNTKDLRAPLLLTGPYGWSGREQDFEVFVNDEITGLLKTHKFAHSDVHAFWDLVNETTTPTNPYRKADGTLTAAALRGKTLFIGQANCVSCHKGDQHGGASSGWIGATPKNVKLDVPHLAGVFDSAPYLHDGRAATLEEIFSKYNPDHLHGKAHLLAPAQMQDLLEYVREL